MLLAFDVADCDGGLIGDEPLPVSQPGWPMILNDPHAGTVSDGRGVLESVGVPA
jgi:hypothetical protein